MPKKPFSNAKIEFLFNPAEDDHNEISHFIENMNEIIEEWVSDWNDKVHIELKELHTTDLSKFQTHRDPI